MWSKEVTIKTSASKQDIWQIWTDVSNWKTWDDQVVESSLDGLFEIGTTGFLKPKGGPKSKFELIESSNESSFTSRSKLPLGKMDFIHRIEEQEGQVIVKHRIEITGLLSFLFSRVIGTKLVKELPKALEKLNQIAENKNHD